jgi:NAD(P)H-flavin reductase
VLRGEKDHHPVRKLSDFYICGRVGKAKDAFKKMIARGRKYSRRVGKNEKSWESERRYTVGRDK